MFKRLSIIVVLLFGLQGCYQSVNAREMIIANAWCADKGGVDYLIEVFTGNTKVFCFNGEHKYEHDIMLEFRKLKR